MPRPNLARAQRIEGLCAENDLSYRQDSLRGSYRQTIRYLRADALAAAARLLRDQPFNLALHRDRRHHDPP